jgi:hypothetical protein
MFLGERQRVFVLGKGEVLSSEKVIQDDVEVI